MVVCFISLTFSSKWWCSKAENYLQSRDTNVERCTGRTRLHVPQHWTETGPSEPQTASAPVTSQPWSSDVSMLLKKVIKLQPQPLNGKSHSLPLCQHTTSNVTGCHRGLMVKLVTERHRYNGRVGYRALSLKRTSCPKRLQRRSYFSSSSAVSCTFSALCMYLKFGHHPHPLGYLCAKFRFCGNLRCWASPWRKMGYSITHSPSLFNALGTEAFAS